jgi:GntP family gluconate:H+ symporter
MAPWQILSITAVAIIAIVFLILKLRVNPALSLVIGAAGLGLATGLGATGTTDTIMQGFGDIMLEVGLLIAWGVLMGAILNEMGAISKLVERLMKIFGPKGIPYAFGLTLGTLLQSIFLDVLLVMSAPLARRIAPRLGKYGTAKMATAMAISLECGIVLMVPGVATVALAGLLGVPLGSMLIFGLLVIIPTILVSVFIMNVFIQRGFWDVDKDQEPIEEPIGESSSLVAAPDAPVMPSKDPAAVVPATDSRSRVGLLPYDVRSHGARGSKEAGLLMMFGPMLLSLVLIGGGALAGMGGFTSPVTDFLSTPVIALLIGLLGTSFVARRTIGTKRVEEAVVGGFRESGQILILTGAGGALAAVVAASGMGDVLGGYFSASSVAPLLVVWGIAAILHIAVGSVSISAITAAGLLAPVAPTLGLDPVLIALAAGAGSLFFVHVTSNTFWLLQSMLGQTTRGTFKTCSIGVSLASVVALGFTLILSLFL